MPDTILITGRFRRCVEVRESRVSIQTDKAVRGIVKGIHAEEKYRLIDILSGHIVKSYMSVTKVMG